MAHAYRAVQWNRYKRLYDAVLAGGCVAYHVLFVGIGAATHPRATIETLVIRATATLAFLLLTVVLSIGPLCRLDPRLLPLLYNRRHLGVVTFLVAATHGVFSIVQFHALGDTHPLVSVLTANTEFASVSQFPFQPLGLLALLVLALMALTSHDFWLATLGPTTWKSLHMLVYAAWGLVVVHVALGVLQAERHPAFPVLVGAGVLWVGGIHAAAGLRERRGDRERPAAREGAWVEVCSADAIADGRAHVAFVGDERVAVFRRGERLFALSNVCPHQGGPLGEGRIVDGCVTCPWHGHQFDPETGAAPPPYEDRATTIPLAVRDGTVWIAPDAERTS